MKKILKILIFVAIILLIPPIFELLFSGFVESIEYKKLPYKNGDWDFDSEEWAESEGVVKTITIEQGEKFILSTYSYRNSPRCFWRYLPGIHNLRGRTGGCLRFNLQFNSEEFELGKAYEKSGCDDLIYHSFTPKKSGEFYVSFEGFCGADLTYKIIVLD